MVGTASGSMTRQNKVTRGAPNDRAISTSSLLALPMPAAVAIRIGKKAPCQTTTTLASV